MKIVLLALMLLPSFSWAVPYCYRHDAAVTSLSTTASALVPFAALNQVKTFMMVNGTASDVQVNCSQSSSGGVTPATPSANSPQWFTIGTNESWIPPDSDGFGNVCFIKSRSGSITSGVVRLCLMGSGKGVSP